MKKVSIKIISLLVLMTLALSSCLNDLEDYMGGFSGAPATAEILDRPSPATGLMVKQFVDPTKKIDITLRINIAVANPLNVATKITLALDNDLIAAYNAEKGYTGLDAGLAVPDAGLLFTSMDVTVPAGKTEAVFAFQVDPTKIANPAALNIIPVKIASAENGVVVSGNFGTSLVQILGRNSWDGIYKVSGSLVDYTTAAFAGYYPKDIHLITTGAWTCDRYDAWDESFWYIFDAGGGSLSYFGNFSPYFKFDASNNVAAVINAINDALPRGRKAVLYTGAGAINKFDPVTKTLDVMFYLSQETTVPKLRTLITEHYVYVGPRPE